VQDALALSIVVMLRRHFEQMGGVVCRLGESIFAVVLPACERADVTHEANACCVEFGERLVGWIPEIEAVADSVRIAMGVATLDDETRSILSSADLLVKAASQAVLAAKAGTGSTTRAFVPRKKTA
jgi:GGDEF domain-containing protein